MNNNFRLSLNLEPFCKMCYVVEGEKMGMKSMRSGYYTEEGGGWGGHWEHLSASRSTLNYALRFALGSHPLQKFENYLIASTATIGYTTQQSTA